MTAPPSAAPYRRNVVFVAGRDPRHEVSGGHSAYVRSFARAALAAGYMPHLFCAASDNAVEATPFGVVHRVASPVRPFRQLAAGFHATWVVPEMVRFCLGDGGPRPRAGRRRHLIHGFGVWGYLAVRAAEDLRRAECQAAAVVSSYTTYETEAAAAVVGMAKGSYQRRHQMAARLRHIWVRQVVEPWERYAYLGAQRLLCNYESVRRMIEAKYGAAPQLEKVPYTAEAAFLRTVVVPDWPPIADAGVTDAVGELPAMVRRGAAQPPLLVSVSRHDPRKGVDVLLHALALLREGGVAFRACLIGGGPLLSAHRELAARLGLGDRVAIVGVVPDPWPYLLAAELFVLPSRSEQSGSLALIEALQGGAAVVASAVDGIAEDLVDGGDALLVPPGDAVALAGALRRCLADGDLRRRLSQGGYATFLARFSPAAVAASLARVYTELGFGA